MRDALLYVVAGAGGAFGYWALQKVALRWVRGSDENTRRFVRSLNHDALLRLRDAVAVEFARRSQ